MHELVEEVTQQEKNVLHERRDICAESKEQKGKNWFSISSVYLKEVHCVNDVECKNDRTVITNIFEKIAPKQSSNLREGVDVHHMCPKREAHSHQVRADPAQFCAQGKI